MRMVASLFLSPCWALFTHAPPVPCLCIFIDPTRPSLFLPTRALHRRSCKLHIGPCLKVREQTKAVCTSFPFLSFLFLPFFNIGWEDILQRPATTDLAISSPLQHYSSSSSCQPTMACGLVYHAPNLLVSIAITHPVQSAPGSRSTSPPSLRRSRASHILSCRP
jgi:hypothetical protein